MAVAMSAFSANAQLPNWKGSKAAEESEVNKIADKTYISPSWLGKTPYLYYKDKTSSNAVFYLVDARTGKKEKLFNKFKNECIEKINSMLKEDSENKELIGLKKQLEEQKFNKESIVKDIAKLLEIRDILMDD